MPRNSSKARIKTRLSTPQDHTDTLGSLSIQVKVSENKFICKISEEQSNKAIVELNIEYKKFDFVHKESRPSLTRGNVAKALRRSTCCILDDLWEEDYDSLIQHLKLMIKYYNLYGDVNHQKHEVENFKTLCQQAIETINKELNPTQNNEDVRQNTIR